MVAIDMTNPEQHIGWNPDGTAPLNDSPIEIQKEKLSLGQRISRYGTKVSLFSATLATVCGVSDYYFNSHRANNAPEIVKEYSDIGPATKELERAVLESKKNYSFEFKRERYLSTNVVSKLEQVQMEASALQNEQLSRLIRENERLKLRKQVIETENPEAISYIAQTQKVSGYFVKPILGSVVGAGVGTLMFAIPGMYTYLKRKRKQKSPTLAEVIAAKETLPEKK